MQNTNKFTPTEILIVIAIIGILSAVAWGAFGSREASAAERSPLAQMLVQYDVSWLWYPSTGSLTIIEKGIAPWTTTAEVCAALKEHGVKRVIFSDAFSTTGYPQIQWEPGNGSHLTVKPTDHLKNNCP